MRKGILLSMMGFGLAAFLMGSATMAWFTDVKTVEPVTFTSGNIEISPSYVSPGWDVLVGNMAPSQTEEADVLVKNTGTLDMKYRMYAVLDTASAGGYVFSQPLADALQLAIFDGATQVFPATGTVALSAFTQGAPFETIGGNNMTLAPNAEKTYTVKITLPSTAGNALASKSVKVTFKFDATQTDNTGWSE